MAFWNWSRTAANNATATGGTWAEGMAPSQVNDTARINASELACYRDDIAGAIVTSGTSTAYTVASFEAFDTLPHLSGQMIAFTPHATNGATVTLNVDSLGAKPLRSAPNTELLAGTIIQGTPYVALYNNTDGAFYLRGFYPAQTTYNIPLGAGLEYWLPTSPNSSFVFPIGQAISRTTYATLFAAMGTTYGTGDGSTTFNLPDKTGRVSAMQEASATRLTSTFFGGNSTVLGAVGGSQSANLSIANINSFTPTGTFTGGTIPGAAGTGFQFSSPVLTNANGTTLTGLQVTGSITMNALGSGQAHGIVPPLIICNYILRIA